MLGSFHQVSNQAEAGPHCLAPVIPLSLIMQMLMNPCCVLFFLLWANYPVNNKGGSFLFWRTLYLSVVRDLLDEIAVAVCDSFLLSS